MPGATVWRISRRTYALDRAGSGASQDGGRWNRPGTAVIYAGSTIAIAALEKFVHLAGVIPRDLVLVRIDLPLDHSAEKPKLSELPKDWDLLPAGPASMDFGTKWARERRSLVLYVPSAVVPEEMNAVANPRHREFSSVKISIERDFSYDPRMYLARRTRHGRRS